MHGGGGALWGGCAAVSAVSGVALQRVSAAAERRSVSLLPVPPLR